MQYPAPTQVPLELNLVEGFPTQTESTRKILAQLPIPILLLLGTGTGYWKINLKKL